MLPSVDVMRPCFKGDFGFGSSRLPADLTPIARGLNSIVRHTILPRTGYRNGFTRLQQWIVSHLVRQIEFDIWDLLISDIEDVIYGSFGRTRLMHHAHWLTWMIFRCAGDIPPEVSREFTRSQFEFSQYDASQLLRSATRVTRRPAVAETAAQRDATIEEIAAAEEAQLEAQETEEDIQLESSDSDDVEYVPRRYEQPRAHDEEAGTSTAVVNVLERMERNEQSTGAVFAEVRARQDEFQQQQLAIQREQLRMQQLQMEFQRSQALAQQ